MVLFPQARPRRLRENPALRSRIQEVRVLPDDLVMPFFVRPGKKERRPLKTLPGLFQLSPDELLREAEALLKQGVGAVMLFGIPEIKDAHAASAYGPQAIIPQALQLLKKELPELLLMADVCLCDYTDHGHCGLVVEQRGGERRIDNDSSLEVLSKIAASYARAGADVIAPSDMMDGRVQAIRDELDAVGFKHLPILSYAVKYASSFYGPFREALESTPQFGDRRSYQMDPANFREAFREASLDIEEGADLLMVKPGLPALDILRQLRDRVDLPLVVYQVSGEYASLRFAAQHGALNEAAAVLETWTAFKRAGANLIVSYFAQEYAKLLPHGV